MLTYLTTAALVLAVNLMPALGPPTWAVLVFIRLTWHVSVPALVALGAVSAAGGRFLLAWATRRVRHRLPPKRVANLEAAGNYLRGHRAGSAVGFALFVLSPIPSAQLFEAAGLLAVPLVPLTLAFCVGRIVSYSIYVGSASLAEASLGEQFRKALVSPYSIAIQVVLIAVMVLLARVNWAETLTRGRHPRPTEAAVDDPHPPEDEVPR
jgi:hypothetical protein